MRLVLGTNSYVRGYAHKNWVVTDWDNNVAFIRHQAII